MWILCKSKGQRRKHVVAGAEYTFVPNADFGGRLACDVKDKVAIEIFLHERNSNLFEPAEKPKPLQRGGGEKSPQTSGDGGAGGSDGSGSKDAKP